MFGHNRGSTISKRYHHRPRARRQIKVLAFSLVLLLIAMAGAGLCVFALKAS